MERWVKMEDISDGKLYDGNDLVRADCGGCEGCSACCRGMGKSIVLDPYDIYRLTAERGKTFEELMAGYAELNVTDGIILPNLSMNGPEEACAFLSEEGRCTVHKFRPGICRLFPLGRFYENGGFQYFLQTHECRKTSRAKIRVRRWIDTPDPDRYEKFIVKWHYFLKDMSRHLAEMGDDEEERRICLTILKLFYMLPYEKERDFYEQFDERFRTAGKIGLRPEKEE